MIPLGLKMSLRDDGAAVVQISPRTWIKIIFILAVCFYGHAKLQCSKLEEVANSCRDLNSRVIVNSQSIAELKTDYHDTTKELRASIQELNSFLREQSLTHSVTER